jgi:8-oxo-dGTP pyrophosphatase MutT (NUDIX family)
MSSRFERVGGEVVYDGSFFKVRKDRFRHEDGDEVERELVEHTGAVGIVVLDGEQLWFVRQPREAVGVPDLLEIPAGKLDEEGEDPLETAKRELAEETGLRGGRWRPGPVAYTTPGFCRERIHLFLADGLETGEAAPAGDEEIELVRWRVGEVAARMAEVEDAKTVAGLLLLLRERGS